MPIKKMIGTKTIISNMAVPKSGCLTIKTTGTAINASGQTIQSQLPLGCSKSLK
jgi:hypothetical protein